MRFLGNPGTQGVSHGFQNQRIAIRLGRGDIAGPGAGGQRHARDGFSECPPSGGGRTLGKRTEERAKDASILVGFCRGLGERALPVESIALGGAMGFLDEEDAFLL